MYWRFGFHNVSAIEGLLDREGVTLEDLFEEEELIQEVKAHNSKLIDFLCKPDVLSLLISYIWEKVDTLDDSKRLKYPFLASEIICCEVYAICEAIVSNTQLLESLWSLLDKPAPLDPIAASYFSKANNVLLEKKTAEMIQFIQSQPNSVSKFITHISSSSVSDLLLKLITLEDLPEGAGVVAWLHSHDLIPSLIHLLSPGVESDMHNVASQTLLDIIAVSYQNLGPPDQALQKAYDDPSPAQVALGGGNILTNQLKSEPIMTQLMSYMLDASSPNATSSLTHGMNVIIELVRRYCSEIEQAEFQLHQYQTLKTDLTVPSAEKIMNLATDLNGLLKKGPVDTTIGKQVPLGLERLKICEVFAEILHLQYLYTSSPLFDRLVCVSMSQNDSEKVDNDQKEENPLTEEKVEKTPLDNITDRLIFVDACFVESRVLPLCLDLFFQFPWNNFLHSVVYDMIAKVFNTYSFAYTVQVNAQATQHEEKSEAQVLISKKLLEIKDSARKLVLSILQEGALTIKIMEAQKKNDAGLDQPRGLRLGYMGHLTYIADEVCKLMEKCGSDVDDMKQYLDFEQWEEYLSTLLHDTKERDRQPLGGARPSMTHHHFLAGGMLDEADVGVHKSTFIGVSSTSTERDSATMDTTDDIDSIKSLLNASDAVPDFGEGFSQPAFDNGSGWENSNSYD